MKISMFAFIFIIFGISCENAVMPSNSIVGKWSHTYQVQNLQPDGTWSEWQTINTFAALPTYEFTQNGRFLLDGKITETCCNPGSKYKLEGVNLTFEYENTPDCRTVKCADPNTKVVELLDDKYLILIELSGRIKNKYQRMD
jgi:hypothetical protein